MANYENDVNEDVIDDDDDDVFDSGIDEDEPELDIADTLRNISKAAECANLVDLAELAMDAAEDYENVEEGTPDNSRLRENVNNILKIANELSDKHDTKGIIDDAESILDDLG